MTNSKSIYILSICFVLFGCTSNDKPILMGLPQSSGSNANWKVKTDQNVPFEFSVRTGQNILWTMDISEVGPKGKTWTLNTPSYFDNKIYHRTSNELICIRIKNTK